jgi:hypothetical protein
MYTGKFNLELNYGFYMFIFVDVSRLYPYVRTDTNVLGAVPFG